MADKSTTDKMRSRYIRPATPAKQRAAATTTKQDLADDDAIDIAVDAYTYAYPLVLMDVTRRVMTNVEGADPRTGHAPMNQFAHLPSFPDSTFTDVVRPNADTLYSTLWFDVSREPLVLSVADSEGRYFLLPMLDLWTDVFASPGKRTTGTAAKSFAIVAPEWSGDLPPDVELIRAPTSFGWVLGRTQTNGKSDYDAVHKFQAGMKAVPLSAWGTDYEAPKATINASISKTAPADQLANMDAVTFLTRFLELIRDNPPHANDYPILERMQKIGVVAGENFDISRVPQTARAAFEQVPQRALARMKDFSKRSDPIVNGWSMVSSPIGTYGTDYLKRAFVAHAGLGANVIEDAFYPTAFNLADGSAFDSAQQYELHLSKDEVPPVNAFWSLTVYNDRQLFADNPINRYAIGDRDKLEFASDGSLTLYIQRNSPGDDKECNWLPAPKSGNFTMNLRLYWPKAQVLERKWQPPAVIQK